MRYQPIDTINSRKNLKLFNSLKKSKEFFRPRDESLIRWYNCGPTVYDVSHMGHARCYISFDIIRRVLKDYFKYNIKFVQNITDIDDKIIKRARQNYLWNKFLENFDQQTISLKDEFENAKDYYRCKILNEQDPAKKTMLEKQLEEANQLIDLKNLEQFEKFGKNVFLEYMDKTKGESITDNSIFAELPRKFESDFYLDMKSLNILKPDYAPRVSEYIDKIIIFIEQIISNGFAYKSSSGSVYFNTVAFNNHALHKYGKLASEAIGDQKALADGEGDLSVSDRVMEEKLNKNDFALWKASKTGEPSWPSKWGMGRPGWHIECSTMACDILGEYVDIHSGGIDLRFPHHENEIAQTESYYNTGRDWVNYFLHTGHLHIEGCKMSKSLKNFISIKEALKNNSSRLIRLAFLLHSWEDSLDYSQRTIQEAMAYEKGFKEFFFLIEHELRNLKVQSDDRYEWTESEIKLENDFIEYVKIIDDHLCDNINTKGCLIALNGLVSSVNIYHKEKSGFKIHKNLLKQIAIYVTKMLKIFGTIDQDVEIGFGSTMIDELDDNTIQEIINPYINLIADFKKTVYEQAKDIELKVFEQSCDELTAKFSQSIINDYSNVKKMSKKEIIYPYVKYLCDFRESIRNQVKDVKLKETKVKLLNLCDDLRDYLLPQLGVEIDDKIVNGQISTLIKLDDDQLSKKKEVLCKEVEDKRRARELEILEKKRKKEELTRLQATKDSLKKIPPSEWFKREKDKYLKFDEMGIPTHLVDKDVPEGKEVNDNLRKNLLKQYKEQEKKYAKYLKSISQ